MSETETQQLNAFVTVRLIGVLASAAGRREIHLSTETARTVAEVITRLLETVNTAQFESYLVEAGTRDPRPNVIVLLNEQDCNLFNGLNTKVEGRTEITIIPVAHGG